MQTKKFITIVIALIVVAGAIGGALYGGVAIGKNQSSTAQFPGGMSGQFPSDMGQFPGGMDSGTMPGGMGTSGTVSGVSGDVITVTTSNGSVVQVYTNSDTEFLEMAAAGLSDITTGDDITVVGQQSRNGSVNATSIIIGSFQMSDFRP